MVDIKTIKNEFPEAYKKLLQWSQRIVTEMHKAMLESGQELDEMQVPKVNDDILSALMMWNERSLFDFFDDMKINISIGYTGEQWVWAIKEEESFPAETRKEAESKAFLEAFKNLK